MNFRNLSKEKNGAEKSKNSSKDIKSATVDRKTKRFTRKFFEMLKNSRSRLWAPDSELKNPIEPMSYRLMDFSVQSCNCESP